MVYVPQVRLDFPRKYQPLVIMVKVENCYINLATSFVKGVTL